MAAFKIIICLLIFQSANSSPPSNWTNPCLSSSVSNLPFCNTNLSFEQRAHDLVYNQERKLENYLYIYQGLTSNNAIGIPQLNIKPYHWWNEALHGLKTNNVTQFPQVITTSSSFNESLFKMIGSAISTEGRALYNIGLEQLTC